MVAMQVRNEYMVEAGKLQFGTAELKLCTFTAVYHEELLANVHYLRRRIMSGSGKSGAAT